VASTPTSHTIGLGETATELGSLLGVDGQRHAFSDFEDMAVLVLFFASNRCPTVKAYDGRLMSAQAGYAASRVQLVAINADDPYLHPEESYDEMVRAARDRSFTFPYLKDEGQRLARLFGADCSFHFFVLDRRRRLRYRGRFDDSRDPARVTSNDLRNALDDLIAGRPVRLPETKAFGCALDPA